MVGGALYSLGGYFLPFVVLGSALFATAMLTICILPRHDFNDDVSEGKRKKFFKLNSLILASTNAPTKKFQFQCFKF